MTISIENEYEDKINIPYEKIINDIIEESLIFEECPYEIEVNVIITNNDEIHKINKEYRNIDRPTDVLSFPLADYENPSDFDRLEESPEDYFNVDTGELMLGDIIVSFDKVVEQAKSYNHTIERELAFLVAHSMLHLFGYDHMIDSERIIMEEKQEKILANKGYVRG